MSNIETASINITGLIPVIFETNIAVPPKPPVTKLFGTIKQL